MKAKILISDEEWAALMTAQDFVKDTLGSNLEESAVAHFQSMHDGLSSLLKRASIKMSVKIPAGGAKKAKENQ